MLVVDDESSVCRAVNRLLRGRVGEILVAQTPSEAEAILRNHPVTHLLCDHRLGPAHPSGTDLAIKWRHQYDNIVRVVILTGMDLDDFAPAEEVDHILPKITDPENLAAALAL